MSPSRSLRRVPPGPRRRGPFGCDAAFRRDPLGFLRRVRDAYGDVVVIPTVWPFAWYLVSHPRHVEQVLTGALQNFPKGYFSRVVRVASGLGLIALDGKTWQKERRLIQPAFHRERDQWPGAGHGGGRVEVCRTVR
jgi:cytochrome P450